jgi:hypothetical protein
LHGLLINGHKVFDREGPRYAYYAHRVALHDLASFRPGENVLTTALTPKYDGKTVHGTEINWPGIMVLIRYGAGDNRPVADPAGDLGFRLHYIRRAPSWVTSVHQVTLADYDHDGDLDWTVGNVHKEPNLYWYEYRGPDEWVEHYMDVVQSECDHRGAVGIGWLENTDGRGSFVRHWIQPRVAEDFHSLAVIDYDNDGDADVVSAVGPLATGEQRTYLLENRPGRGHSPTDWQRHVLLTGHPCHEALAGDVDGDGDIDVVIKGWTSGSFLFLENRK